MMEIGYRQGEILANRYQIVTILKHQSFTSTYSAIDLVQAQTVLIKVITLALDLAQEVLNLFVREAESLCSLNRPYLAKYLAYFQLDAPNASQFCLVREFIPGTSLDKLVKDNWYPTETEVKNIGIEILSKLKDLHSLNPSIIHRNLKPENIIIDKESKIYLVDLGTIERIYRQTIISDLDNNNEDNFLASEQISGKALPASDLYSLSGILVFLLTRSLPKELPTKNGQIDLASYLNLNPEFIDWLEINLETKAENRFKSAAVALEFISPTSKQAEELHQNYVNYLNARCLGSPRILKQKSETELSIEIFYSLKDVWFDITHNLDTYIENVLPASVKIAAWLLTGVALIFTIDATLGYLILPIFVLILVFFSRQKLLDRSCLKIDLRYFSIHNFYFGGVESSKQINLLEINAIEIDDCQQYCVIKTNYQNYKFGFNLERAERRSLILEIHDFLAKKQISDPRLKVNIY
jgi:eukaryotic-like serine/threonine-protein kinase